MSVRRMFYDNKCTLTDHMADYTRPIKCSVYYNGREYYKDFQVCIDCESEIVFNTERLERVMLAFAEADSCLEKRLKETKTEKKSK